MLKHAFSFEGRIRRTDYALSLIIYVLLYVVFRMLLDSDGDNTFFLFLLIPMLWFLWAQGAKRCHDIGVTGWNQGIPFYVFWMIFEDGYEGTNEYGDNPKAHLYIWTPDTDESDEEESDPNNTEGNEDSDLK